MKKRISVTLDESTLKNLKKLLNSKKYRNVSHAVETAIDKFIGGEKKK
jgi:Arc/MetJ-type ribon-helix-helix transcriptional regulator